MDDRLESFVTLLNKQRQARPPAPEPVRAPSWTQRMFSKRPDAAAAPVPQPVAPQTKHESASDSPAIATATAAPAPDAAAVEAVSVAPVETAPELAAPAIAAEVAAVPAVAADETIPAQIVADTPPEAIAAAPAVVTEQSVPVDAGAPAAVAEAAIAAPIAEAAVVAEAAVATSPEEIASATSAEVAVATPEAAPEIAIVAAPEPVAEPVPEAGVVSEAAVAPVEPVEPVEAVTAAAISPEEIVSAASAEAAPEIAAAAVAEPVADPIAEAVAVADETVPPVEAPTLAATPPQEIISAASVEEIVAAAEAVSEIATIAAAEPVAEPIAEAPTAAEAGAAPVEATATSAADIADIVVAPEAVPTAAAPPPEAPAPASIPEAASPLIAAIFARIARPDSVSAAIADSATAAMRPADAPAIAETNAVEADAAPVPAPVEPFPAEPATDALRDPHDLLARFLAETDLAVTPAPEQVLAEAAAKLDEVLQAVTAEPAPTRADDDDLDADGEAAVPLPVMAEAVTAARVSRGYLRYGLTAIAVVAGVVTVGGAYWSTQMTPTILAGARDTAPTAAMTAMNVAPAQPAATPADPPAAAPPAAPKAAVKANAAAGAPRGAAIAAAAATVSATLPPPKPAGGLAIVEAKPAPEPPHVQASSLASMPRQLAMLTPPPPEPPPTPVTSSMAAPRPAAPPSPPAAAAVAARGPEPAWQRNAVAAPAYSGKPQIAIVIDDLGIDRDRTQRSVGLDSAVTLSFLAYASDLPTQTEAARGAGHELIVHVPMEPAIRPKYISQGAGGEAQAELLRRLRWDLSRFSGYVGVNNHMGSRLSADPRAMHTVIDELKARGLLFLDSRLDGNTLDVARHEGLAAVGRDVLLDDDITAGSVVDRLAQVEKVARERGTAIALGHPHDQTINALKLWIASLPAKGLQLVPLSAVVKDREAHVAGAGGGAG